MTARAWLLVGVILLAGCRAEDSAPAPRLEDEGPQALASAIASARRPSKRYYLAREASHCEVYWVDGPTRSKPSVVPCPASVSVGGRIRLAGDGCLLEGAPGDEVPVVCPSDLTGAEYDDREKEKSL